MTNPYFVEKVNENLLHNWYFAKPINQRGITHQTQNGYFIDRWHAEYYNAPNPDITLVDGGLALQQGSIMAQPLEDGTINAGEIVTASVLYDNTLLSGTIEWSGTYTGICADNLISANNDAGKRLQIFCSGDFTGHILKALKLEKGSRQTLAHLENGVWVLNETPVYEVELLKCQRFYLDNKAVCVLTNYAGNEYALCNVSFPIPMRIVPTVTIQTEANGDGTVQDCAAGAAVVHGVVAHGLTNAGIHMVRAPGAEKFDISNIYVFNFRANAEL